MRDVMVDIEAMGQGPDAAIVAIAAVFFDPFTGVLGPDFYEIVDLRDSAKYGTIDAATVLWWLKQDAAVRDEITIKTSYSLKSVLHDLQTFFKLNGPEYVRFWGNGVDYDKVILESAFRAVELQAPWKYHAGMDVRTVVDIGRRIAGIDPKYDAPTGISHHALDDAKNQIRYVSAVWGKIAEHFGGVDNWTQSKKQQEHYANVAV